MVKIKTAINSNQKKYQNLIFEIGEILSQGRKLAFQKVNSILTATYWQIGKQIVEFQQGGKRRAEYGEEIIKQLSIDLTKQFGKGFSVDNLENMRRFYLSYQISETVSRKSFKLSWSHYLKLMRIGDIAERKFYEIECEKNSWSLRELCRQFDSALFERLALNRDKKGVKKLSEKGQLIEKPQDIFKEPYVLEFLGLDENQRYSESELESALIGNLEKFLLEL
jgi:hypothetical protein